MIHQTVIKILAMITRILLLHQIAIILNNIMERKTSDSNDLEDEGRPSEIIEENGKIISFEEAFHGSQTDVSSQTEEDYGLKFQAEIEAEYDFPRLQTNREKPNVTDPGIPANPPDTPVTLKGDHDPFPFILPSCDVLTNTYHASAIYNIFSYLSECDQDTISAADKGQWVINPSNLEPEILSYMCDPIEAVHGYEGCEEWVISKRLVDEPYIKWLKAVIM